MGETPIQQHILQNLTTSVALLEKHAEQTNSRFDIIGEKLEKLVERLEALTLSNTKLITMHDERIKDLIRDVERLEDDTDKAITAQSVRIGQIEEHLHARVGEVKTKVSALGDRLTKLEQWRLLMMGVGMAVGALLTYVPAILAFVKEAMSLP